ncbi:uncharacterized protein MYCFIDRAFT_75287 [Pseudocercospora fijiensis CIRAD86]|uniref:Uncharacterized protein n=1 Tax=Pseudocercospora fijiensis (strain CIRAD86) TaxID=383855 RepID=N1Q5U2_PSEFD|nr:uncharacterized protein MYCFIDRAFT_75287 [Pseudocercospora fijiensis CIRAD86]EME87430.1 hypothetical protein MYCFIDRAFT_75287 [Pseudocercospora fijiensis CIRAD86]
MAVHRGIQSAIFYYLSCAPCADARVKKRRKREAAESRRDRLALEQDEKNVYVHPGEASTTNPNWQSEIELGPHGRRKKKTGNSSQRGLAPSRTSNNGSTKTSSVDLPQRLGSQDSRWNHRVYQREDEELWGSSSNMGASLYAGSLRRPERAKTADSSRSNGSSYYASRNPPVNDMHPATVTKIASREEVMWMMQPLPVAEVMNGKERAPRSRSDSGGSRMSPSRRPSSESRSRSDNENNVPTPHQSSDGSTHDPFVQRSTIAVPDKAVTTKPGGMTQGRTFVARHIHEDSEHLALEVLSLCAHLERWSVSSTAFTRKHNGRPVVIALGSSYMEVAQTARTMKQRVQRNSLLELATSKHRSANNSRCLSTTHQASSIAMSYLPRTPSDRPSTKPLKSILKKSPQLPIEESGNGKAKPYSWTGYKGKADIEARLMANRARQQTEQGTALAMEGAQLDDAQSTFASESPVLGQVCAFGHQAPVNPTRTRCCGNVYCFDCVVQHASQKGANCPNCGRLINPHDLLVVEDADASIGSPRRSERIDSAEPTDRMAGYPKLPTFSETNRYPNLSAYGHQETSSATTPSGSEKWFGAR